MGLDREGDLLQRPGGVRVCRGGLWGESRGRVYPGVPASAGRCAAWASQAGAPREGRAVAPLACVCGLDLGVAWQLPAVQGPHERGSSRFTAVSRVPVPLRGLPSVPGWETASPRPGSTLCCLPRAPCTACMLQAPLLHVVLRMHAGLALRRVQPRRAGSSAALGRKGGLAGGHLWGHRKCRAATKAQGATVSVTDRPGARRLPRQRSPGRFQLTGPPLERAAVGDRKPVQKLWRTCVRPRPPLAGLCMFSDTAVRP